MIGKHFGKTRLINGKSLEGSLTMFVVSLIVLFMVTLLGQPSLMNTSIVLIPFIALLITLTELITPYGLDNLSIPVVTTLLFFLMMQV
jgi:phytol kinase